MNPLAFVTRVAGVSGNVGARVDSVRRRPTNLVDRHAVPPAYEQLAQASDAELARIGTARAALARDVCETFDTAPHRNGSGHVDGDRAARRLP
jgi:hypothetical protein